MLVKNILFSECTCLWVAGEKYLWYAGLCFLIYYDILCSNIYFRKDILQYIDRIVIEQAEKKKEKIKSKVICLLLLCFCRWPRRLHIWYSLVAIPLTTPQGFWCIVFWRRSARAVLLVVLFLLCSCWISCIVFFVWIACFFTSRFWKKKRKKKIFKLWRSHNYFFSPCLRLREFL